MTTSATEAETKTQAADRPSVFQVAISTRDLEGSRRWYADGLGLVRSGEVNIGAFIATLKERGEVPPALDLAKIQGLPEVDVRAMGWLLDQRDFFQLEIFQYEVPAPRPRPADWTPADIGYTSVGAHVADLDACLGALAALGTRPSGPVLGEPGRRRVCVSDPDGVVVELREDEPWSPDPSRTVRPDVPTVFRSVTISVAELAPSRRFLEVLGFTKAPAHTLHVSGHEALWGLDGATRDTEVLRLGDFFVELVHYLDPPGRPRRRDYRISDQGLLNIGVGTRTRESYTAVRDAVLAAGHTTFAEAVLEFESVTYVEDPNGISVELTYLGPQLDAELGFVPETGRA